MKIIEATYYQAKVPFKQPIKTSYATLTHKSFDLLVLTDEDGYQGLGELSALSHPDYLAEFLAQERFVLQKYLLPQVLHNQNWDFSWIKGHNFAKATLDQCLWDLKAKRQHVSLNQLLKNPQPTIEIGASLGIFPTQQAMMTAVETLYQQGYRRFKFKVSPNLNWQWFKQLKQSFPQITLWADANGSFVKATPQQILALDEVGFALIEQPLASDDLIEHAKLQTKLNTPLCLDESLCSLADLAVAQALGSCQVINLKLGRVGGLTLALELVEFCQQHNLAPWVGAMYETGVGRAFNWHFASQACFTLVGDLAVSRSYLADDIIVENFTLNEGCLKLPTDPGCGVKLDFEKLKFYSSQISHY